MKKFITTAIAILIVTWCCPALAGKQQLNEQINAVTKRINRTEAPTDKAQQLAIRARLYTKKGSYAMAEQDYAKAINIHDAGWLWRDLGYLCLKQEKWENAYKISQHLKQKYPTLEDAYEYIEKVSSKEYQEDYLEEHPPQIVMNKPAPKVRNRFDVMAEQRAAREAAQAARRQQELYGASSSIRKHCRDVAGFGGSYSYTIEKTCIEQEVQAKTIVMHTPTSARIKKHCQDVAGFGSSYSHTIEKTCIEQEKKARGAIY